MTSLNITIYSLLPLVPATGLLLGTSLKPVLRKNILGASVYATMSKKNEVIW